MRITLDIDDDVQESFYGFRPLPASGRIVTNELINRIRDEENI